MSFFRTEVATSPVNDLLEKLEDKPIQYSPPDFPPPSIPALRLFLNEEEVLRECRADNQRLINYLCKPEIVMDLVQTMFELPPRAGPARPDATGSKRSATSTDSPQPMSEREQAKEHHMKHAHVALELLTSDNKRLSEAIINDDRVVDRVLSYLEQSASGDLHTNVAAFFNKLMLSLLKTHPALTTHQMAKRGQRFVNILLKHIDSEPISELIVRILDSPDATEIHAAVIGLYTVTPVPTSPAHKLPTPHALDLLSNSDILSGLAECFVHASNDALETHLAVNPIPTAAPAQVAAAANAAADTANQEQPAAWAPPPHPAPPGHDALLGKHPLETSVSDRPAQKPRSQDDDTESDPASVSNISNTSDSAQKDDLSADDNVDMADAKDSPDLDSSAHSKNGSSKKVDSPDLKKDSENVADSSVKDRQGGDDKDMVVDGGNESNEDEIEKEESVISRPPTQVSVGVEPDGINDVATDEVLARRGRLREETMTNVTSTMLGLTKRVLQMPVLGAEIPEKLSVFATPVVIARLLDAGIYARLNGAVELPPPPSPTVGERAAHVHRVETFSAGGNSALMHALRLTANLLTTEANEYRDDEDDSINADSSGVGNHGGGLAGAFGNHSQKTSAMMVAMMMNPGRHAALANAANSAASAVGGSGRSRKEGDKVVPTTKLEAELCARFNRLAPLLEEGEGGGSQRSRPTSLSSPTTASKQKQPDNDRDVRPLGSLRLTLAEFFVACIQHAGQDTVNIITRFGVPRTLLRLFERYRWSSMLHGVITTSIIACMVGGDAKKSGRAAWFDAGLIPWIIEVWQRNSSESADRIGTASKAAAAEAKKEDNKGMKKNQVDGNEGDDEAEGDGAAHVREADDDTLLRWRGCGYMGHIIRIGDAVNRFLSEYKSDISSASQGSSTLGLPPREQAVAFWTFADRSLIPAYDRQTRPLVSENADANGGGASGDTSCVANDVAEEATEVLDMGGIQFVESISATGTDPTSTTSTTTSTASSSYSSSSAAVAAVGIRVAGVPDDDEGEIKPVDTTSLDDDIKTVEVDVFAASVEADGEVVERIDLEDHDIPASMRQRLDMGNKKSESSSKSGGSSNRKSSGSSSGGSSSSRRSTDKHEQNQHQQQQSKQQKQRSGTGSGDREDMMARMQRDDNKDSSSEDEGSYIAYVDDRKEARNHVTSMSNSSATSSSSSSSSTSSSSATSDHSSSSTRARKDSNRHQTKTNNKTSSSSSGGSTAQYDAGKLASQVERMRVGDEPEVPSASLDGVVIEIDDENEVLDVDVVGGGSGSSSASVGIGAKGIVGAAGVHLADDEANSSDDEDSYESWEELVRKKSEKEKNAAAAASASKLWSSSGEKQGDLRTRKV